MRVIVYMRQQSVSEGAMDSTTATWLTIMVNLGSQCRGAVDKHGFLQGRCFAVVLMNLFVVLKQIKFSGAGGCCTLKR